jgi:hypothetical protein
LVLGAGDIKPNGGEDEDEDPKELANDAWKKLLNQDDGVYSLKPWEEVSEANSKDIAKACREIVRQAWSEYCIIVGNPFFHSNLGYQGKSGRRGKITWNKILENPRNFIHPRFLLETEFGNPTRIHAKDVQVYWEDWVSRDTKGNPFSFLSVKGKEKMAVEEEEESEEEGKSKAKAKGKSQNKGKGKEVEVDDNNKSDDDDDDDDDDDEEEEEEEEEEKIRSPSPDVHVDDGIPLPCECNTPALRTSWLQELVSQEGEGGKFFHKLIDLVNALEVSFTLATYFPLYLTLFQDIDTPSGYQNSRWPFVNWSWDRVHLDNGTLEDCATLDTFLGWLKKKIAVLAKQESLNKNQLQELLLGIGLLIRDIDLSLYTDHHRIIPDEVVESCLVEGDVVPLFAIMKSLSSAINHVMR